jgi:hypothetical protein
MTLEEMTAQRDAQLAARFRGVCTVKIEGRRVTFATDAEVTAAINSNAGLPRLRTVAASAEFSRPPSRASEYSPR